MGIFDGKKHGCAVAKKWEAIARTKFNKAKTTKAQATARLHKCVVKGEKTLKKGRERKAKAAARERSYKHRYDNHCCCFLPVGCFGKPSCRVCGFGNHHVWPGTCITSRRCNRL